MANNGCLILMLIFSIALFVAIASGNVIWGVVALLFTFFLLVLKVSD